MRVAETQSSTIGNGLLRPNSIDPNAEKYGPLFNAGEHLHPKYPKLGAHERNGKDGYDFAISTSRDVDVVDFCLVNPENPSGDVRYRLQATTESPDGSLVHTGFIEDARPGDLYGVRVNSHNEYADYDKLLLDPHAQTITRLGLPDHPDSPAYCVIMPEMNGPVTHPEIDPKNRIIMESHVKGATMLNPDIPEQLRGTYLGLSHPAYIDHLKELGVTTIEIMPIMQFFSEEWLADAGKSNYWGYNTIGFFTPHEGYAAGNKPGDAVQECRKMIDQFHEADIEVVLDVVYNHTAEGGIDSPTYSFRGLNNDSYYRTLTDHSGKQYYEDFTGCGNNIDTTNPTAARLIRDSLAYWHNQMGVDGFRFDLAYAMHGDGTIFDSIKNHDKRLKNCLLIAEPWAFNGYPRGSYAKKGLGEWDGEYRNVVRDFWNWRQGHVGKLATHLASGLDPSKTINFITAHDGFTMRDLVSYDEKHNEANGEDNRDGASDNRSNNHGYEGETDDPEINNSRLKTIRSLLMTLLMSYGTPMLLDGDDRLHSQQGNNNPYCQDNEISWRNWDKSESDGNITEFIASLTELRKRSAIGGHAAYMGEKVHSPVGEKCVDWLNKDGDRMSIDDWHQSSTLGMYTSPDEGEAATDSLLFYINGGDEDTAIHLPDDMATKGKYELLAETKTGEANIKEGLGVVTDTFTLEAMSSAVLRRISCQLPNIGETTDDRFDPKLGNFIATRTKAISEI